MGEERGDLPDTFATIAVMYEARAERMVLVSDVVLVPLFVCISGFFLGFFVIGLFLPLIALMEALSG
jgi:type II secretory pathway component PulF